MFLSTQCSEIISPYFTVAPSERCESRNSKEELAGWRDIQINGEHGVYVSFCAQECSCVSVQEKHEF